MSEENGHLEIEVTLREVVRDADGKPVLDEDGDHKMKDSGEVLKTTLTRSAGKPQLMGISSLLGELNQSNSNYTLLKRRWKSIVDDESQPPAKQVEANAGLMDLEKSFRERTIPIFNQLNGELKRVATAGAAIDDYEMIALCTLAIKYVAAHEPTEEERKNLPGGSASS